MTEILHDATAGLRRGDLLPHFSGFSPEGSRLDYERLWQRRNVLLLVLASPAGATTWEYVTSLDAQVRQLVPDDTSVVVAEGPLAGLPVNTVVVADRWGEVVHCEPLPADPSNWPPASELVEWAEFVRRRCPECPP